MARPPPKLHQAPRGFWYVKWGGKHRYIARPTAPKREIRAKYHESLKAWMAWRESRQQRMSAAALSVLELADRFLDSREREGDINRRRFYARSLKRFVRAYGGFPADAIRPMMVQRLKDAMLNAGKAPATINHDLRSVRTMFTWATDLELVPPVSLRGVRYCDLGPVVDKSMSRADVRAMHKAAPPELRPWLAITYLCAMRPSETVRVVGQEGEWVQRGVYAVANKAWRRVRLNRHVLFSAEAFGWLRLAEPRWRRLDSFSAACRRACGQGPGRLRHSAATHLLDNGVPRQDVDEILGHYPPRVSLTYMRPRWRYLRRLAARITLGT